MHIDSIALKAQKRLNLMMPLKFKLDRRSLEVMYTSFVLPTMEYANVVWGGTYDSDLCKLEKIHVEGMRLITGATAQSNIAKLYEDTGFCSFKSRCEYSMLVMMYKMKHNMTPTYLNDLLPPENQEFIAYNLRNREDVSLVPTRLDSFKRSFLPTAIRLWNKLKIEDRHSANILSFKSNLKRANEETNVLYYYGQRWAAVHHARLRIGCSKLKYDLCFNLHVIGEPKCGCGANLEDADHFFLFCPNYDDIRVSLYESFPDKNYFDIHTILYGSQDFSEAANKEVFEAVHKYITDSKRFT